MDDDNTKNNYRSIKKVRTNISKNIINTSYRDKQGKTSTTIYEMKLAKKDLEPQFVKKYLENQPQVKQDQNIMKNELYQNDYRDLYIKKLCALEHEMHRYSESRKFYNR